MEEAVIEDFPIGMEFDVEAEGATHRLVVEQTQPIKTLVRKTGSFRVQLLGPAEPILEQSIYPLRTGDEVREIFIVPISKMPDGVRYEAVFN